MPTGLFSNCTHLVKFNEKSTGGRWYESIVAKMSDGKSFYCKAHDNDQSCKTDVVDKNSSPGQGDTVISYGSNSTFAFKGRINGTRPGEFFIEFDDGYKFWVPTNKVFKYSLC